MKDGFIVLNINLWMLLDVSVYNEMLPESCWGDITIYFSDLDELLF